MVVPMSSQLTRIVRVSVFVRARMLNEVRARSDRRARGSDIELQHSVLNHRVSVLTRRFEFPKQYYGALRR